MKTHTVTIRLPDPTYQCLKQRAEASRRTVEDEILDILLAALPPDREEPAELLRLKAPDTWTELTGAEQDVVWQRFYRDFDFQASIYPDDWPGIREPAPSITYAIPERHTDDDLDDLHRSVLCAFRACTRPDERIYALDWQHPCFWFRPHGALVRSSSDQRAERIPLLPNGDFWRISVVPDGDYSIFLAEDFRFGIFGHPWEGTWCVFGPELLAAFEAGRPRLWSSVKRRRD